MKRVFFIQFLMTRKCNQNCYYCRRKIYKPELIRINIKKIKKYLDVISELTDNIFIELSGGEPGLVENFDEIFYEVKENKQVYKIRVMSNGLVRVRFPELIKDIDSYQEHLTFDLKENNVIKFYDLNYLSDPNVCNILVKTESVKSSILCKNIHNKIPNLKVKELLCDTIIYKKNRRNDLCMRLHNSCSINFEEDVIYHCNRYIKYFDIYEKPLTPENVSKIVDKTLFTQDFPIFYCTNMCRTMYVGPEKYETHKELLETTYNRIINDD